MFPPVMLPGPRLCPQRGLHAPRPQRRPLSAGCGRPAGDSRVPRLRSPGTGDARRIQADGYGPTDKCEAIGRGCGLCLLLTFPAAACAHGRPRYRLPPASPNVVCRMSSVGCRLCFRFLFVCAPPFRPAFPTVFSGRSAGRSGGHVPPVMLPGPRLCPQRGLHAPRPQRRPLSAGRILL